MKRIVELVRMIAVLEDIENRKQEVKEAFIKEFDVEPTITTVDSAERIIDFGPPVEVALEMLKELGYNPRSVEIELKVTRTTHRKDTDWWPYRKDCAYGLQKYSNGFEYTMTIRWKEA